MHQERRKHFRPLNVSRNSCRSFVKLWMRIALGGEAKESGDKANGVQRFGACHHAGGSRFYGLDRKGPKMLVEPRAPNEFRLRAWLQDRAQTLGAAASDKAEIAPVCACHRLEDDARSPMIAHPKDEAVVPPFHGEIVPLLRPPKL